MPDNSRFLNVSGLEPGKIAYNPAVFFQSDQKIIAARVESLTSDWLDAAHYDSHVSFFTRKDDSLHLLPELPTFHLAEDPFATWYTDSKGQPHLLFGVIAVDFSVANPQVTARFYTAPDIASLDPFHPFAIVHGMKDLRVIQLPDRRFAVFTRPDTGEAAPGRIGFVIIDHLKDISTAVYSAPLLPIEVSPEVKMGTNELHLLPDGKLLVICHTALVEPNWFLHYSAEYFILDPTNPFSDSIHPTRLANRAAFPPLAGPLKGQRFTDVVFPGGIGRLGETELYCGVSDSAIATLTLPTSFFITPPACL